MRCKNCGETSKRLVFAGQFCTALCARAYTMNGRNAYQLNSGSSRAGSSDLRRPGHQQAVSASGGVRRLHGGVRLRGGAAQRWAQSPRVVAAQRATAKVGVHMYRYVCGRIFFFFVCVRVCVSVSEKDER